ncbi:thiol-disulfide isomerase/thioredoxin [Actinoplanes lutulentus]|uniref:Thiol-disulfide isomerase/thioredoxin n=1 Tax=Actinoplanes lutulentus TaxID=1287878 RepID=A0A327ZN92_9ACTN|nr:redoxin domain-containing protein [Actinoplanes lutulentus]MBB2944113.1 thiol-disulfide isomerase/thioredoxin [Actinoplanes lutulentus]RAK42654.1 thiol-disulfide isomerase/thioredoxin [Actinoplanes lutulentus]
MRVPKLVLALLATLVAAAGCATAKSALPAAASVSASPAVIVPQTLTFSGTTLDGAAFDAASLAGKPAMLWFWAPWCATCASEAQSVADLHDEYGDRLGILGIGGLGTNDAMKEFVSEMQVGAVPHLSDPAGKLWQRFGIAQQSWYVFVDAKGTIVHRGYLDDLQLTTKVKELTA